MPFFSYFVIKHISNLEMPCNWIYILGADNKKQFHSCFFCFVFRIRIEVANKKRQRKSYIYIFFCMLRTTVIMMETTIFSLPYWVVVILIYLYVCAYDYYYLHLSYSKKKFNRCFRVLFCLVFDTEKRKEKLVFSPFRARFEFFASPRASL